MNVIILAALMASSQPAAVELDYGAGSLAYVALVRGDLQTAERQLLHSRAQHRNDPAWLLNYGQLLARQGRVTEANELFRRVAAAPDSEIVLANGDVVGTREASRRASRALRADTLSARR